MMRSTWRRFWDHFWRMRVTLGSLWGQFGVTFGVWGSLWTTLGSPWKHFGVTCPPKRAHKQQIHTFPTYFAFSRGHDTAGPSFRLSGPRSFWGYFWLMAVTLGHPASTWNHRGVTLSVWRSVSEKHSFSPLILMILLIFSIDFNAFVRLSE